MDSEDIHMPADVLAGACCFHVVSDKSETEAAYPSEKSVIMYKYKRCHSPQHFTVQQEVYENLKFHVIAYYNNNNYYYYYYRRLLSQAFSSWYFS